MTMLVHCVFTLTPTLSHQGRGGFCRLVCLVVTARCGYCLESSMTATYFTTLWIPAYAGMTVWGTVLLSPSDPSVKHWDRLFDSSSVKGEGDCG